jgi:hypothetical protein
MKKDFKYTAKFSDIAIASVDINSPELEISEASLD